MNLPRDPAKSQPTSPAEGDSVLDWARATGEADHLVADLDRYVRRRRARRFGAASVAGLALAAGVFLWQPRQIPGASSLVVSAPVASLAVTGPQQRTLADGSVVELKPGAELDVQFTASLRRVVLRGGEAHFGVAKNPDRPFVVVACETEVRAVGTAFTVGHAGHDIEVVVTEGRVRVATGDLPAARTDLIAGEQARVAPGAAPVVATLSPDQLRTRLAWRVPRLEFVATPLEEVLALTNAHAAKSGAPALILTGTGLGALRVSGVLRADDTESLLRLLDGEFGIAAERSGGEIRLRRR